MPVLCGIAANPNPCVLWVDFRLFSLSFSRQMFLACRFRRFSLLTAKQRIMRSSISFIVPSGVECNGYASEADQLRFGSEVSQQNGGRGCDLSPAVLELGYRRMR